MKERGQTIACFSAIKSNNNCNLAAIHEVPKQCQHRFVFTFYDQAVSFNVIFQFSKLAFTKFYRIHNLDSATAAYKGMWNRSLAGHSFFLFPTLATYFSCTTASCFFCWPRPRPPPPPPPPQQQLIPFLPLSESYGYYGQWAEFLSFPPDNVVTMTRVKKLEGAWEKQIDLHL